MTRGIHGEGCQPVLRASAGVVTVDLSDAGRRSSVFPVSAGSSLGGGPKVDGLWEQVFSEANMVRALDRVVRNGGAAGVDGMEVDQLQDWWAESWPRVLTSLEEGKYRPAPVRRVEIPKPGGGSRWLGVPTVVDRVIQQAVCQVLVPVFDPMFSDRSFGYRPGRSAHQAVETARGFIEDGFCWVVEIDLERFFDRVNHDMVMARVARRVADKRLLKLVRAFVEAGVMTDGVRQPVMEGVAQGSPLSPLLSNVMLDDLDRELESRGHLFVRYADDVRVYVRSERAGRRVLESVSDWIEKRLKLAVNRHKSGVGYATQMMLLGFGFFLRSGRVSVRVAPSAVERMKQRIRQLTSRSWGVSLHQRIRSLNRFIAGWVAYFRLAETPSLFTRVDQWLRRRLRQVLWVMWKNNTTRVAELRKLGAHDNAIFVAVIAAGGPWRASRREALNRTLTTRWWRQQGLTGFKDRYQHHHSS